MLVSKLLGAAVMFCLCALIPFLWWRFAARRPAPFWGWLGFTRPKLRVPLWALAIFAVGYYLFYSFDFTMLFDAASLDVLGSSGSVAANAYTGLGLAAVLPIAVESFLGNGLPEELFFRGFLTKRFSARCGRTGGILLQAVCFGAMHNFLYLAAGIPISMRVHAVLFCFTGGGALLLALLNERLYNGSIWPSILLHGLGNCIANLIAAFS